MPELELSEHSDLGVDETFSVMFGAELFNKFHHDLSHLSYNCEDWALESGSLRRQLSYELPPNPLLRMPVILVKSSEVATKEKDGSWTISGNAVNEGSTMAQATRCSAVYSIRQSVGGMGSDISLVVNYSFELSSIPWFLQKTIELAMHREMQSGHRKFLTVTKDAITSGMRSPLPPAYLQQQAHEVSFHSKPSSCANSSVVGGSFQRDAFFTPLATPNHIPEEQVTPIASEIAPLDWSVDRDVRSHPTTATTSTSIQPVHLHSAHSEQQPYARKGDGAAVGGELLQPKSHRRERTSATPAAAVTVDIPPHPSHPIGGSYLNSDTPKMRPHPRGRYRRLTILVLALAAAWCLGHMSAGLHK